MMIAKHHATAGKLPQRRGLGFAHGVWPQPVADDKDHVLRSALSARLSSAAEGERPEKNHSQSER